MDPTPDVLAGHVRMKRNAIDNDLELLRVKTQAADPRPMAAQWGKKALPFALGATAVWMWRRRRRAVTSLKDLLVHELVDLYRMERQLVGAFNGLAAAASNPDLVDLFRRQAEESQTHVARLDRALRSIRARPSRGTSGAVTALLEEGARLLRRRSDPDVRDAWLIATAQRMAHLQISNYGTARTFAETLGYTYAAELLQQALEEERAMDGQLTRLAERFVNLQTIR